MLTPLGLATAAGSAALYAAGWWLGYPEPAALGAAGLAASAGALLWTLPRPRLEVRREIAPEKVARGEPAVGVLHVTNAGRAVRGGLAARDTAGSEPVAVDLPRMRSGARRTVTYRLSTARRGEIPVGPLRLVRADPLGLARRVRSYGTPRTLLVRPRTVPLGLLPSGRAHHLEGPTSEKSPAGTATFHALREYVVGDELRHVHWKSSARTGTLMVRRLVDASLPTTTVLVDDRAAAWRDPDDFELAVDVAASVAVGAARASFPVRVLAASGPVAATRGGPGDAETVLDRLTRLALDPGGDRSVTDALRGAPGGGSLVVVVQDGAALARLGAVRARYDRVVALRVRPGDGAPVPPGVQAAEVADLDALKAAWPLLGRGR
ncbi:DUF58 domain-containing protein [Actinomadura rayongensis]|uniref:DUF58 domain-containing protein n=1 Tax=Actinomadura rayongensis TaxID=1429076 RepID=A0A6I4WEE9_9ACTN|nr:DUF58 domain-containing protein [Actinomadura rayongensis]MXQ67433.1 DUF58 domain-containing protein [Actinomadura rayongensis]